MPAPTALDLRGLFRDPDMFDSNRSWRKAGFDVEGRGDWSNIMVASRSSPNSLYDEGIASMEGGGSYNQTDAEGFLRIQGLPQRVQGRINKRQF